MNFIRKPLWVLFAFLALGCQSSQAMEQEEKEKNYFSHLSREINYRILKEVFNSEKTEQTNFQDIGIKLSLVCKDWKKIIKTDAKRWVCEYFNIEKQHKDDFWRFFKGKLIYKPNTNNDEGRVDLFFSAVPNPFNGTFDLSKCGDAAKYLSFHLGIPTENKEPAAKAQTWIFFSPHVANQLEATAWPLSTIFPVKVPVGMLWTWGKCNDLDSYDYLTTESPENLSKINIYENWEKSDAARGMGFDVALVLSRTAVFMDDFKFCL